MFFILGAPGGTGKRFSKLRHMKGIALTLAETHSGIAATNLSGGRTLDSASKLSITLTPSVLATCKFSKGSDKADVLKNYAII